MIRKPVGSREIKLARVLQKCFKVLEQSAGGRQKQERTNEKLIKLMDGFEFFKCQEGSYKGRCMGCSFQGIFLRLWV